MNILLIGSGGREHAFAWRIAQESGHKLFIAPGNPGMQSLGVCLADIGVNDFSAITQTVRDNAIDLVVVGPEVPLVNGLVDHLHAQPGLDQLLIVGPDASGARLEGSKDFSKAFMLRYGIPTARYQSFIASELNQAQQYLRSLNAPYVLKADGLAAGKGVVIASTLEEADRELEEMLSGRFGQASACVVIEEYLTGIECSVFVACDGQDYRILPVAKDYKRILEGDQGPNTGGMGSVSPVCFADETFMNKVEERIVRPTLEGLKSEGIDYRGFIFIGIMNVAGEPYVIEYNCRMGDPETESVLPRIESNFVDMLARMAKGQLGDYKLVIDPRSVATVVLVSAGYPGTYSSGHQITLPRSVHGESVIFHAGTSLNDATLSTAGGRVLTATSYGVDIASALENSYQLIEQINYEGKTYRTDIGQDLLRLEGK